MCKKERAIVVLHVALTLCAMIVASPSQARDRKAPEIKHKAVHQAFRGQPLKIKAKITDRSGLFEPTLYYRTGHSGTFKRLPLELQGKLYQASIPASDLSGKSVEYFIESYDQQGNGPARFASPNKPIKVIIKAPPASIKEDKKPAVTTSTSVHDNKAPSTDKDKVKELTATQTTASTAAASTVQPASDDQNKDKAAGDDEEHTISPWVIVGASTLGVAVVASIVGGVIWYNTTQTEQTAPGVVSLQISAPPPYSSALRTGP